MRTTIPHLKHKIQQLEKRVSLLEKIASNFIEIEKVTPKDLTKEESKLLKETSEDIKHKRWNRFMTLEELERKLRR